MHFRIMRMMLDDISLVLVPLLFGCNMKNELLFVGCWLLCVTDCIYYNFYSCTTVFIIF